MKDGDSGTVLVVDSVSCILSHHLSGDAGGALVGEVMLTLRRMARMHEGCVLGGIDGGQGSESAILPHRFIAVVTNGSVIAGRFRTR